MYALVRHVLLHSASEMFLTHESVKEQWIFRGQVPILRVIFDSEVGGDMFLRNVS
jgi:hypothetical protein